MGTASLRTRSDWTKHALIGLRDANGYISRHYSRLYAQRYPALNHCRFSFFLTANVIGEFTLARGQHRSILLKVPPLWLF